MGITLTNSKAMRTFFSLVFLLLFLFVSAQNNDADTLCIVSYNVENLFDCKDDTLKNDQEFLPEGGYHWTPNKYKDKLANISRVITTIGGWKTPILVGLYEVENEKTLTDLTKYSPLKNLRYKFIHAESPDRRGIDVALLYEPKQFKLLTSDFFQIIFPDNKRSKTRDILYASGKLPNGDTLHVFVNHFPSRLGGEKKSEPKRIYVASVLRNKVDSIRSLSPKANILIMGDFNDYPTNKSMQETLGAKKISAPIDTDNLYNLVYHFQEKGDIGSNKYRGIWGMLDQIIVTGNMLLPENTLYTNEKNMYICQESFLLEDDTTLLGKKPFRTYIGKKYHGGYSDHLPIYVDIIVK